MGARFLVVPQWQGSGSSRAMRLIDGAQAILGDLPAAATRVVQVPLEAGESLETGIHRFSSLVATREAVSRELGECDDRVITIGGDCGVSLASVQRAVSAAPSGTTALVWFDAHGDLNDTASSPSGAFAGMVLRALLGDAPEQLASAGSEVVQPDHVILAGARALDDEEVDYLERSGIHQVNPDPLSAADDGSLQEAVVRAVRDSGATRVYLHVDLDVLDPGEIHGVSEAEPFGLTPGELTGALRALRTEFELAGATVAGFAPESPESADRDLPIILRILGALTAPVP
jgi:arginase